MTSEVDGLEAAIERAKPMLLLTNEPEIVHEDLWMLVAAAERELTRLRSSSTPATYPITRIREALHELESEWGICRGVDAALAALTELEAEREADRARIRELEQREQREQRLQWRPAGEAPREVRTLFLAEPFGEPGRRLVCLGKRDAVRAVWLDEETEGDGGDYIEWQDSEVLGFIPLDALPEVKP